MAAKQVNSSKAWTQTVSYFQCQQCGREVLKTGARHKYCVECAASRIRKSNRERAKASWVAQGGVSLGAEMACAQCSRLFLKFAPFQRYCSLECKAASKRVGPVKRGCETCGVIFLKRSQVHKFCDACSEARAAIKKAECRERNKESIRESRKRWIERNPDKVVASRKAVKSKREYRDRSNAEQRRRRQEDPAFAINARIRAAIGICLRGKKAGRKWEDLVGYSSQQLMTHLERQFKRGMTWANRDQWHLDHIVPLSSFEFDSPEDDGFKAAWALTNLRPIWKSENLTKWARRTHLI